MKQWLTETLSRMQQHAMFLPELFLGIVSCFWFRSDTPKPEAFDNRNQKIILFLLYLVVCVLLKLLLHTKLLRGKRTGRLSSSYISFFLAMIELGWFFDLYIVGYSEKRTVTEVLGYVFYWYLPLLFILAVAVLASGVLKHSRIPFLNRIRMKKQRKRRRAGMAAEEPSAAKEKLSAIRETLSGILCRMPVLLVLLCGYLAAGCVLFLRFRNVSASNLSALNARNRLCEGIKIVMFVLLFLYAAARKKHHPDDRGISDNTWGVLSFLTCILTAGMYLLASESGSAIIMVLFAVLTVIYFFSERWGFVLVEMGILSYVTGWIADRSFRRTGYPALITEVIGQDRWNRLYHLEAFPQVLEMRTVLRRSELLRGLVPYTVEMTGKSFTRVEDFSYLNLVSVFGSLAAFAVMAYYIMLLLRVFFRLNDTLRGRGKQMTAVQQNAFLLAQFACLYIVTHALVHVVSNLSFLFFTGVPLPFISKGLSNLFVVLVFSVLIVYCLHWEENHAKKTKKPVRTAR